MVYTINFILPLLNHSLWDPCSWLTQPCPQSPRECLFLVPVPSTWEPLVTTCLPFWNSPIFSLSQCHHPQHHSPILFLFCSPSIPSFTPHFLQLFSFTGLHTCFGFFTSLALPKHWKVKPKSFSTVLSGSYIYQNRCLQSTSGTKLVWDGCRIFC